MLAEDETYVTFIDSWGIRRRDYKHQESMSEFLEYPVKTRQDWLHFNLFHLFSVFFGPQR